MHLPPPAARQAGWFADWALEDLAEDFPGNADLTLRATLDTRLQAVVEARLEALLGRAGRAGRGRPGRGGGARCRQRRGARHGRRGDYRASQFNRATSARRQPGSAFKPVFYLAALEHGLTPDDLVADGPLNLGGWSPGNGGWRPRGEITLEEALAHSVNTAAVRVLLRAGGPRAAMEMAARLGIEGRFPNDASLALGTGGGEPAGPRRRLCGLRQWRAAGGAAGHRQRQRGGPGGAGGPRRAAPGGRRRTCRGCCGGCWKRWCRAAAGGRRRCPARRWRARPAPPRISAMPGSSA